MSLGAKLVFVFCLCLALKYQTLQANPVQKRDISDWLSVFFDYEDSTNESDSEEYLLCRNCTIIVAQETTAAPATSAPTQATAAPTNAPTAAPTTAPTAPPTAPPTAAPTTAPTTAPTAAPTTAPTATTAATTAAGA